jgi:hypothetical protein
LSSFIDRNSTTEHCSSVFHSSSTVTIWTTETSLWTCACVSATLDCHEARLCCYLLRPLQLFYFHLWHIYWLSLILIFHVSCDSIFFSFLLL